MEKMTCADAIVQSLIDHGVETVFGLPGAQTYAFFDALYKRRDSIQLICSRHEQGAAYMAYGYAKSTGRIGVYCVVPGPGVLNTTAALCTAHNAPVLCLTGQVPSEYIGAGHGMLHELPDQLNTLRTLTKWAARITHAAETPAIMAEAVKNLQCGRVAPVAVEVPGDILAQTQAIDTRFPDFPQTQFCADPGKIAKAAQMIANARAPMIMVGSGAVHAKDEVAQLARMIQAPVVSFRGGRGIVSDESVYGFTCAEGYKIYSQTDLMIGVGTRLELPAFRWQEGVANHAMIRVDIDPTQMVRLRGDVSIVSDAKLALQAMIAAVSDTGMSPPSREEQFAAIKEASRQEIKKIQPQMTYLQIIREVLPRDGFLVDEVSQVGFASWYGFPVYQPRQLVTCGYQGNLGYGFQTALGVKVANPDAAVVSIAGDGGFMFGVQELATAVQYQIGLVLVIFNNNAFGNVRRDQINFFDGHVYGSDLHNPDFVKLAHSFGARGYRTDNAESFRSVLESAISESKNGPVVIEVVCETGSEASPFEFIMPANYGQ